MPIVYVPRLHCTNCRSDREWPKVGKVRLDKNRYSITCNICNEFLKIVEPKECAIFEKAYGPLAQEKPIIAAPPTPDSKAVVLTEANNPGYNNSNTPSSNLVAVNVEEIHESAKAETPLTKEQKLSEIELAQKQIQEQLKKLEELKKSL